MMHLLWVFVVPYFFLFLNWSIINLHGLPRWCRGKESACQCRRCKRCSFDPWVRKIPWRRAWKPTPVFLPRESHGQRSLEGCGPWGRKESDTTEPLNTYTYKLDLRYCVNFRYSAESDSDTHTHTYKYNIFFRFFTIISYYKILNGVPCAVY